MTGEQIGRTGTRSPLCTGPRAATSGREIWKSGMVMMISKLLQVGQWTIRPLHPSKLPLVLALESSEERSSFQGKAQLHTKDYFNLSFIVLK